MSNTAEDVSAAPEVAAWENRAPRAESAESVPPVRGPRRDLGQRRALGEGADR
jgi:hypothetical protein